jgi:hypothetical protein
VFVLCKICSSNSRSSSGVGSGNSGNSNSSISHISVNAVFNIGQVNSAFLKGHFFHYDQNI